MRGLFDEYQTENMIIDPRTRIMLVIVVLAAIAVLMEWIYRSING